MTITVEFYGIARQRAGVSRTEILATRLNEALTVLRIEYPKLAEHCFQGNQLRAEYTANINGERFVSDPQTPLEPGDTLLIFSADAGG